jgi:hypothetical protein
LFIAPVVVVPGLVEPLPLLEFVEPELPEEFVELWAPGFEVSVTRLVLSVVIKTSASEFEPASALQPGVE